MLKKSAFVLTLSLAFTAQAEVRFSNSMKEALSGIETGDVVVLDIDNTILEPVQTLGSDQWVEYLIDKNKKAGLEPAAALEAALTDWAQVQKVTDVRLVEGVTPRLIRKLQFRGIMVLALTARPNALRETTINQLRSIGVSFGDRALFADGKNKGVLLKEFFTENGVTPRRLIFVDDKEKNVNNMDAAFQNAKFPNINYRYGAADHRVRAFSEDIAELQWAFFIEQGTLISDEEAEEYLGRGYLTPFAKSMAP